MMEDIRIAIAFRQEGTENDCRGLEKALRADGNVLRPRNAAQGYVSFCILDSD